MGVDLVGAFAHSLSKKEILELPERIDSWTEVTDFFTS